MWYCLAESFFYANVNYFIITISHAHYRWARHISYQLQNCQHSELNNRLLHAEVSEILSACSVTLGNVETFQPGHFSLLLVFISCCLDRVSYAPSLLQTMSVAPGNLLVVSCSFYSYFYNCDIKPVVFPVQFKFQLPVFSLTLKTPIYCFSIESR